MTGHFFIERLAPSHDREPFRSGIESLDQYLRQLASQDTRRRFANCFVAVEHATGQLAGFYTLSAAGLPVSDLPDETTRRLPHYPMVPAVLIGRLAVDLRFRGRRLGESLLMDAADRVLDADPAVFAVVVDAKDESAASFYKRYAFRPLATKPLTLFLPVAAIDARRRQDTAR